MIAQDHGLKHRTVPDRHFRPIPFQAVSATVVFIVIAAKATSVCLLIPVGPDKLELIRAADVLAAAAFWEPAVTSAVLIDDSLSPRSLDTSLRTVCPRIRLCSLHHPRMGRGHGLWGGLTEGVLAGLTFIDERLTEQVVVRLDGDSMVIGPFARALAERFEEERSVGLLGTVYRDPQGRPRAHDPWHAITRHYSQRWGRCRGYETGNLPRRAFQTVIGPARQVRRTLGLAFAKGYVAGEHAQGGGYAVSRAALSEIVRLGLLQQPDAWRPFWVSEDVIVSVMARAAGFQLADFNGPGEVFGVQYRGLPYPPDVLVSRGYSIVHSLKHDRIPEQELRLIFRDLREGAASRRRSSLTFR